MIKSKVYQKLSLQIFVVRDNLHIQFWHENLSAFKIIFTIAKYYYPNHYFLFNWKNNFKYFYETNFCPYGLH